MKCKVSQLADIAIDGRGRLFVLAGLRACCEGSGRGACAGGVLARHDLRADWRRCFGGGGAPARDSLRLTAGRGVLHLFKPSSQGLCHARPCLYSLGRAKRPAQDANQ